MTGPRQWPPKGTRPTRPDDTDLDKPIYVSLPQHVIDAEKTRQKSEETSGFRRLLKTIGRFFGRS